MNTRMKARFAAVVIVCAASAAPAVAPLAHGQPAAAEPTATGAPSSSPPPFTTPDTSACPHREHTPPPVDESEAPLPGQQPPPDLPVPATAVGGTKLGSCELVWPAGAPQPPADTSAAGWVLADIDSGEVLAAKDPHGRHRPASTIKVLLALVVLEHLDMDATVTGTQEDADIEGSKAGVGPGGTYTNRQLLLALMMNSGNDAANNFARQLGGVERTVELMNQRARQLGAFDTRTASPAGLDGPGMSTSAYDLALIFQHAMDQPAFREAVSTVLTDFPGYPANPAVPGDFDRPGFAMANDNLLLQNYPGAIGGKTGFTNDSRHTFLGAAERDGRRLVAVLLRGEMTHSALWQQAAALLDYGFALDKGARVGALVTEGEAQAIAAQLDNPAGGTTLAGAHGDGASPGADDGGGLSGTALALLLGGAALVVALAAASYRISRDTPRHTRS